MLAEGTETCPRCGKALDSTPADDADLSSKEIWNLTVYSLRYLLVPLLVIVFVAVVCLLIFFR
jgi:hypothetical protein